MCTAKMLPVLALASLLALSQPSPTLGRFASYLPVSYNIPAGATECLYERITEPNEHLTASVFVLSGEELRAPVVFEGPVAPVDLDMSGETRKGDSAGRDLNRYLKRYENEGVKMFVDGKFGDRMMNVRPVRVAEMVDFEEEEEDYMDDYEMTDDERKEFNEHHDLEHQHFKHPDMPDIPGHPDHVPPNHPRLPGRGAQGRRRGESERSGEEEEEEEEGEQQGGEWYDDEYMRERAQMREAHIERMMEMEAETDDDFVKLQMENQKSRAKAKLEELNKDLEKEDAPKRRKIVDNKARKDQPPPQQSRRRLREEHPEVKLLAGEPYQKTIQIESPGWYRLCVHSRSYEIEVEMELRKSSTYGKVDPRTGHVPSLEDEEIHEEIHHLFEKEDDERILEEEGAIEDEDLRATKQQMRILERVYADIMNKQREERRMWNWRTIKNQHIHSHLVLGNLVETIVYMGITGWQVYTIRKWFSGGPSLGR